MFLAVFSSSAGTKAYPFQGHLTGSLSVEAVAVCFVSVDEACLIFGTFKFLAFLVCFLEPLLETFLSLAAG